jgi:hypothetical protein
MATKTQTPKPIETHAVETRSFQGPTQIFKFKTRTLRRSIGLNLQILNPNPPSYVLMRKLLHTDSQSHSFFFFIVILRYGVPRPISSHFKSRAGGGGVEPVAYYQLQDGTVPPVPVVVSGVEASLFQSEAASVKIKNKNLNVNISAVEGQGRREKKPGLSWIEIWLEGEIWAADKKRKEREEGGYVGGGGKKKK